MRRPWPTGGGGGRGGTGGCCAKRKKERKKERKREREREREKEVVHKILNICTHYTEVLMRESVITHVAVMTLFLVISDTFNVY